MWQVEAFVQSLPYNVYDVLQSLKGFDNSSQPLSYSCDRLYIARESSGDKAGLLFVLNYTESQEQDQ